MYTSKYRVLTTDELDNLEAEFIQYLVLNGIEAKDWESLKAMDTDTTQMHVAIFSDLVFEKILIKTQYIVFIDGKHFHCFQFLSDKILLFALEAQEKFSLDPKVNTLKQIVEKDGVNLLIYHKSKNYTQAREIELFEHINNGCEISDGQDFKALSLLWAAQNN